ncbi:MAG: hypothetical protein U0514_00200 [Candidatus Andersenbacteria bacterium]
MEIKRSPDVVRPVEVAKKAPRWPWVVGISLGAVVLLGVGVVAYVMFSQRMQPTAPQASNAGANNATNQTSPSSKGHTVNPTPTTENLTKLVFARYDDPLGDSGDLRFTGPLTLVTSDLASANPREQTLATLDRREPSTAITGVVSPNGQFAAVVEQPGSSPKKGDEGKAHVWLVDLTDGGTLEQIADNPQLVGQLVWSPDSKTLIWGEFETNGDTTSKKADVATTLVAYDVPTGESQRFDRPGESVDRNGLLVVAVRDGELFVVRQKVGTDDVGTLGVLKLGKSGALDGDFEKLLDLPPGLRGMDVAPDGTMVVLARGTGSRIDSAATGPFMLELFDRETNDTTQLRSSPTERYTSPTFTPNGKNVLYAAASGLWSITIKDSGDRNQLIDVDQLDSLVPSADLTPLLVQPDLSNVVFSLVSDTASKVFSLPFDSTEANANDTTELSSKDLLGQSVLGWTE